MKNEKKDKEFIFVAVSRFHCEETITEGKHSVKPSMRIQSSSVNHIFVLLNPVLHYHKAALEVLICCLLICFFLLSSLSLVLFLQWWLVSVLIFYLIRMIFVQTYSQQDRLRQKWLRRAFWWKIASAYFPIRLHKTCDLSADRSYIFGCHPHGIISLGAFVNFGTEATGFSEKFPGIDIRLLTLKANMVLPCVGFFLSALGLSDASKQSCKYILDKGNGNSLMLVLGGVKEILDAHSSSEYILTLRDRKGFVKLGLVHGASLVPVFSFGENDLYEQIANPRGSKLRHFQVMLYSITGYTMPLLKGRGVFQDYFGFMPKRRPIDTYVGEPIELPKLSWEELTDEIVDRYHQKYMDSLTCLFNTHKAKHGDQDATIKFVTANNH